MFRRATPESRARLEELWSGIVAALTAEYELRVARRGEILLGYIGWKQEAGGNLMLVGMTTEAARQHARPVLVGLRNLLSLLESDPGVRRLVVDVFPEKLRDVKLISKLGFRPIAQNGTLIRCARATVKHLEVVRG